LLIAFLHCEPYVVDPTAVDPTCMGGGVDAWTLVGEEGADIPGHTASDVTVQAVARYLPAAQVPHAMGAVEPAGQ
jgi:hypothetical protein